MSLTRMTSGRQRLPETRPESPRSSQGQEPSPMMSAPILIIRTQEVHPKNSRRESKLIEEPSQIADKGLDKMITDLTQMRDGVTMTRETGTTLCLGITKIKEDLEVHLRSSLTRTTTTILEAMPRAAVEATTGCNLTASDHHQTTLSALSITKKITIEVLHQCTQEMSQDHPGINQGILQAGAVSEAGLDLLPEVAATWVLATSKGQRDQATTLAIVPSEWTRSVTNPWRISTVAQTIRLSEKGGTG